MISFVALTIDTLLPAYGDIKSQFGLVDNQLHWIVTFMFIGFSLGQITFGPLSDRLGRHKAVLIGVSIYLIGCGICLASQSYTWFLIGRLIQGFGIGGPRVISQAICRDLFSGDRLARVNSFIMSIFILVPIIAPLIGQIILSLFHWKFIIVFFIIFSLTTTSLLKIYIKETLKKKTKLSISTILISFKEVLQNINSVLYILSLGFLLGGLLTFINVCQPLYHNYFNLGVYFPLAFAGIAAMLGLSSYINSRLVTSYGAFRLSFIFSFILSAWTIINLLFANFIVDQYLVWFSLFMMTSFFCFGMIFGNLNALAINPFGHISGYASSVIGSVSTFVAILISGTTTTFYDGTPFIIIVTLTGCSFATFLMLSIIKKRLSA